MPPGGNGGGGMGYGPMGVFPDWKREKKKMKIYFTFTKNCVLGGPKMNQKTTLICG